MRVLQVKEITLSELRAPQGVLLAGLGDWRFWRRWKLEDLLTNQEQWHLHERVCYGGSRAFVVIWQGEDAPRGARIHDYEIAAFQNSYVKAKDGKFIGTYENVRHRRKRIAIIHLDSLLGLVASPDNASFTAGQECYDAADPDWKFTVTVHLIEAAVTAGNFWENREGRWRRVLPERVLQCVPTPDILAGELMRFVQNDRWRTAAESNMRIKMAIVGLQIQVEKLTAKA